MVYGRVYSIRSHQTDDIYIGSTIQTLSQRMTDHRADYKQYLNKNPRYVTSYEILQYNDAYIELLFEGEFESRNALDRKEGEYQRSMDCVNKRIEGRTKQEHYEDNKEEILVKNKQYYKENKPHILEQIKEYREKHHERLKIQKKKYCEDHPEEIKARSAKNYEKNKEKEKKEKRTKYTCVCGSILCKGEKARHERSKKHQAFIQCLSSEESSSLTNSFEGPVEEMNVVHSLLHDASLETVV